MSVPVLSWSFYVGRNWRGGRSGCPARPPRQIPAPPGGAPVLPPKRLRARSGAPAPHTRAARGHTPPDPQSQSFSRSYGSVLPTSLIYILLSTRGYTPWRPDAVMSTPGGANTCVWCSNFQGPSAAHRTRGKPACFTSASTPSPGKPIPGYPAAVNKKR